MAVADVEGGSKVKGFFKGLFGQEAVAGAGVSAEASAGLAATRQTLVAERVSNTLMRRGGKVAVLDLPDEVTMGRSQSPHSTANRGRL